MSRILIIDYGSQFTQLIARRVREARVYSEIHPPTRSVEWVREWGPTVILSDGDVVFQPHKVERSGVSDAVDGRVLIYIHKEEALDDVERRFPAEHYVLVDDKPRILAAVKRFWGDRVTTVFARQGSYARDAQTVGALPPADVMIERIGDLLSFDLPRFRAAPPTLASKLEPAR